MKKRPNIVIINPDQMRADSMSHLGNTASATKNLDMLANEGVSFRNAFCQNPVCTPSRCSFMTGWYPHVNGHRTMTHMLQNHEPVLLKYLKEEGYHVWLNGRNDLIPAQNPEYPMSYCSTYFIPKEAPERPDDTTWRGEPTGDNYYSFYQGITKVERDLDQLWVEGARDFIRDYDSEEPFCVFLPLMNPHPVYAVPEPYFSMIDRKKLSPRIDAGDFEGKPRILQELHKLQRLGSWEESRFDELRATYLAMCCRVDDFVGMIVNQLKEKGVYDDTAIFVFSDHGDYTGDYGLVEKVQNCFEDCLTKVPFLVKLPDSIQTAKVGVQEDLVELIDFYATVEEITGLQAKHTHFGKSLVPYLQGKEEVLRDAVFCEGGFRKGEEHCKETGGGPAPTPEGLYYPRQSLQCSDEMYNGKAIMCRTEHYKYVRRLYEMDELYNLKDDPQELNNLANDVRYNDVLLEMKERLLTHYMDTCDVVPFCKDQRFDESMRGLMR